MADINFILDGKAVTAAPGETILSVATKNGIEIPTLCFNGRVSRTTACFVCVVKDKKTGRFLPSCSACPVEGQEVDASSEEVRDMRRTALGLLLSEHTGDCEAPCTMACPAHASVEEYVRAGRQGDFKKALEIIKQRIPLPMSIGRVCPRFCEKDCRKNVTSKPVSINDFKRLAADLYYEEYMEELPELKDKKVAIVGAGPAGLSAAYYLRRLGYGSRIFERMPEAGGMLRYGIPEFRLPKATLRKELEHFKKMGIEIETGKELGKDFTIESLKKEYQAVIVTVGSWASSSMRIDGEELAQQGIKWLEGVASANWKGCANPGKTVVVGGGNTAMDAARAAKRAEGVEKVTLVYRRNRRYMPADLEELELAIEDGVEFMELASPVKQANGKLVCNKMKLGDKDASGRRVPVETGETVEVDADTVIAAVGEKVDLDLLGRYGIAADAYKKGNKKYGDVYVVGDASRGPATVADAIADAKWVIEDITGREIVADIPEEAKPDKEEALLRKMKLQMPGKCEADRCINCNTVCESCVSVCPNRANVAIAVPGKEMRQILHVDYMCNECGNCAHFCPYTDGRPYKDKFTLFANEKDFEDSENNGFMVVCTKCPKVKVRLGGAVKEYTLDGKTGLGDLEDLMLTVIKEHGYLLG